MYCKRKGDAKWKEPGRVLRQDGQQVSVKYGSVYVRVHPCRLMLESNGDNTVKNLGSSTISDDTVNNAGRSTAIKIGTDPSHPEVNCVAGHGNMYSDKRQRLILSPKESFMADKIFQNNRCSANRSTNKSAAIESRCKWV